MYNALQRQFNIKKNCNFAIMTQDRDVTFKFKQFSIDDSHCGMKVGTDGVVLGAWCNCSDTHKVIDVGSGSGLIALMVAQRCNALIDAIETDSGACHDAQSNINCSPWRDRINLVEGCFTSYRADTAADMVVSNPPFFTNGEEAHGAGRALARHEGSLNYSSLIDFACRTLTDNGRLAFIYPSDRENDIIYKAEMSRLKLRRVCHLRQNESRPVIRDLFEFSRIDGPIEESTLTIIKRDGHSYTRDFAQLCRDFYLEL